MCGGDRSEHLAFKLSCVADAPNAPTGMWQSERVCQSQALWFYMNKSPFLVSGPFELGLTVSLGSLQGLR